MEFKTYDGVKYFVVPDCAFCSMSGKNPMDMDECPFNGKNVCVPDGCDYYDEKWNIK